MADPATGIVVQPRTGRVTTMPRASNSNSIAAPIDCHPAPMVGQRQSCSQAYSFRPPFAPRLNPGFPAVLRNCPGLKVGAWSLLLCAALLAVSAVRADPPPAGSEDAIALSPYSDWVQAQKNPKLGGCCSIADGRTVDWRVAGGHYQVHFRHPESLSGPEPIGWIDVPDDAVLRAGNPTGEGVAWWYGGVVRCFAPASGS